MANTLAYYNTATITAVKSFIVQAPGQKNAFFAVSKKKQVFFPFLCCQVAPFTLDALNANQITLDLAFGVNLGPVLQNLLRPQFTVSVISKSV